MKRSVLLVVTLLSPFVSAQDINCKGEVTWVMDYPQNCNGNMAFKTSSSNGKWICPPSDKGDAIVLAALAAAKRVEVYIDSQGGAFSCSNLPDYVPARYIIINP